MALNQPVPDQPDPAGQFGDHHEIWWIFSPFNAEWAGLRIGHFHKPPLGDGWLVVITGETDPARIGMRVWSDIATRELWYKVKRIPVPIFFDIVVAGIDPINDPPDFGADS